MSKNFFQSERAVSEVIGYALVLGIVVSAIGLIYVAGVPALQSSKDTTQFKSVEQGFLIFRTDLLKVALDQAPVRTTKLGTAEGGSLSSDPSACKLSLTIFESENPVFNDTLELGSIEFASRIGSISCENGAVITKYPSGSIMTSKPRMFNSTDQGNILFSLVKINDSFSSVGGGVARITISNPRFNESIFNTPEVYRKGNLKIKVESEYADAWRRFFEDEFDTTFSNSTDGTTGWSEDIPFNKLVVVEYIVSVDVG